MNTGSWMMIIGIILLVLFLIFGGLYWAEYISFGKKECPKTDCKKECPCTTKECPTCPKLEPCSRMRADPNYNRLVSIGPSAWNDNDNNTAITIIGLATGGKIKKLQSLAKEELYAILTGQ